jgi:hypothetical protein
MMEPVTIPARPCLAPRSKRNPLKEHCSREAGHNGDHDWAVNSVPKVDDELTRNSMARRGARPA